MLMLFDGGRTPHSHTQFTRIKLSFSFFKNVWLKLLISGEIVILKKDVWLTLHKRICVHLSFFILFVCFVIKEIEQKSHGV